MYKRQLLNHTQFHQLEAFLAVDMFHLFQMIFQYHRAVSYTHLLKDDPNVNVDYHVMYKYDQCVGLAMVTTGNIDSSKYFEMCIRDRS